MLKSWSFIFLLRCYEAFSVDEIIALITFRVRFISTLTVEEYVETVAFNVFSPGRPRILL